MVARGSDNGPTIPMGPSVWRCWIARSNGQFQEGRPLYRHTYLFLYCVSRKMKFVHLLLLLSSSSSSDWLTRCGTGRKEGRKGERNGPKRRSKRRITERNSTGRREKEFKRVHEDCRRHRTLSDIFNNNNKQQQQQHLQEE